MAKKRKALRPISAASQAPENDRRSLNETFADSEDEFFAGRDKILLDEEPAAKRRRKREDQDRDLQSSDEEVFVHDRYTLEGDVDYDTDSGSHDAEKDNGADTDDYQYDSKGRPQSQGDDEENEGEEENENWGTSKADYYSADVIETEADAIEEESEARRLQQKQLKAMTDADFGLDESAWAEEFGPTETGLRVEKLPDVEIPENASGLERMDILRARYPEFELLVREFGSFHLICSSYRAEVEGTRVERELGSRKSTTNLSTVIRFRALSAYLGTIAMYLALLTGCKTGNALSPAELRAHPVMATLVRAKGLWESVRDMMVPEGPASSDRVHQLVPSMEVTFPAARQVGKKIAHANKQMKVQKKSRSSPSPDTWIDSPPVPLLPAKIPKTNKNRRTDLALLSSSIYNVREDEPDSDFGDEDPLTAEEAAEKARKKKSLRFYTSQIAQKANMRGAASRMAGGDDDVPYKERMRDKQDRLVREAEARGKHTGMGDEDQASDDDNDGDKTGPKDADEDYYDMLVSKAQSKKAEKAARAAIYAASANAGSHIYEDESVGPDGKRKITYAIEKNKGLAPKRKKDVRNPRVKKKKKYEEKMKKLGSVKQVYKGGEGRGGYGGEITGIKTNLVKSVKL